MCFRALEWNSGYADKVQRMANTIVQSDYFQMEAFIQQSADWKPILVVTMWKSEVCLGSGCLQHRNWREEHGGNNEKREMHRFRFDALGKIAIIERCCILLSTMPYFFFVLLLDNTAWHATTSVVRFHIGIFAYYLLLMTAYLHNTQSLDTGRLQEKLANSSWLKT